MIHVITSAGWCARRSQPARFHGTGPFDVRTGEAAIGERKSFTSHFSDFMVHAGAADDRIVAITAAMADGTGLRAFSQRFPNRFFDVGIAEQHAVTMAAGLAAGGRRPVVAVYSTFLQRAYDQVLHDVAIENLPVVFAIDRAGIVGEDGYTHQGAFDVAFMRHIPQMTVMSPKDEAELYSMMQAALQHPGPCAVRYPRSAAMGVGVQYPAETVEIGRAELIRDGRHCAIFALGPMVCRALEASRILSARGVSCAVVNARFVKPLDTSMLMQYASSTGMIITVRRASPRRFTGGCAAAGMTDVRTVSWVSLIASDMGARRHTCATWDGRGCCGSGLSAERASSQAVLQPNGPIPSRPAVCERPCEPRGGRREILAEMLGRRMREDKPGTMVRAMHR